jgi:hypothetical protein
MDALGLEHCGNAAICVDLARGAYDAAAALEFALSFDQRRG